MDIKILDFIPDQKGTKQGYLDIKVTYDEEKQKWDIFRGLIFFEKNDGSRWITQQYIKRGDQWICPYERSSSLHKIFNEALSELLKYFERHKF